MAIVDAAFELFEERGYDETTVDDIAERAGVGRTTFFRHFGSKEAVIFPAHDELLAQISARLKAADPATRDIAVTEAARIVLRHYVAEGDRARQRYRLIGQVPALRDRENAGQRQYHRTFAAALVSRWADRPDAELRADLMAAAVVAAHNYVLRRWLRGDTDAPEAELSQAMGLVVSQAAIDEGVTSTVVVVNSSRSSDDVVARIRMALDS